MAYIYAKRSLFAYTFNSTIDHQTSTDFVELTFVGAAITTKSAALYAFSASSVAVKSKFFSARYFSIYSSWIGDLSLFISSTFSGMISTALSPSQKSVPIITQVPWIVTITLLPKSLGNHEKKRRPLCVNMNHIIFSKCRL